MYPLSMLLPAPLVGFACANDEAEHISLTEAGYGPAFVKAESAEAPTLESVKAALDAAGIEYDKRLGLSKLIELLPKA
jgi:hypothetical protein